MARVFVARDRQTNALVALKVLEGTADLTRFEREAHILASTTHPNIVRYVAHGTTKHGEPWLAMEWLEGEDLATRLAQGAMSVADVLTVARAIASALAHAHESGLTHRDLKPGNVFLAGGDVERVKLLDFGIARDLAEREITATGVIMGTPQYMPPEQAMDAKRADSRADVFSLGAMLFHCVLRAMSKVTRRTRSGISSSVIRRSLSASSLQGWPCGSSFATSSPHARRRCSQVLGLSR